VPGDRHERRKDVLCTWLGGQRRELDWLAMWGAGYGTESIDGVQNESMMIKAEIGMYVSCDIFISFSRSGCFMLSNYISFVLFSFLVKLCVLICARQCIIVIPFAKNAGHE